MNKKDEKENGIVELILGRHFLILLLHILALQTLIWVMILSTFTFKYLCSTTCNLHYAIFYFHF